MIAPLRIFIGYDARETVAYHVLTQSIMEHASGPVTIMPLKRDALGVLYTRRRQVNESTDFSMTRFLVPYLCGYDGVGIFFDCDMLVRSDIYELQHEAERQCDKALLVCQHDYAPRTATKFLGQPQAAYPRKNWSSVMVFHADRCRALTPHYVNTATGLELHRLAWVPDREIGSLPLEWNWLVGEYAPNAEAHNLHWTLGGPYFDDYANADHADAWRAVRDRMVSAG